MWISCKNAEGANPSQSPRLALVPSRSKGHLKQTYFPPEMGLRACLRET
jgi:hypothetical protein